MHSWFLSLKTLYSLLHSLFLSHFSLLLTPFLLLSVSLRCPSSVSVRVCSPQWSTSTKYRTKDNEPVNIIDHCSCTAWSWPLWEPLCSAMIGPQSPGYSCFVSTYSCVACVDQPLPQLPIMFTAYTHKDHFFTVVVCWLCNSSYIILCRNVTFSAFVCLSILHWFCTTLPTTSTMYSCIPFSAMHLYVFVAWHMHNHGCHALSFLSLRTALSL